MKRAYMKAHLRVGDGNTVASRVYFRDDAARTGKVHAGWASTFGERFVDPVAGRPGGGWATAQPEITYRRQVGGDELRVIA
ncbi:hypothetical protein [Streptomyces sp. NPDC048473]|uniref:hypothetical protein n=1 Tax=unclassified Streptomyces TaxID=2593676 RepID=UPI0037154B49